MTPGPDHHFHHGGPGWSGGPGWHLPGPPRGPAPPWWDWWPLLPTLALAVLVLAGVVLLGQRIVALLDRTPLLAGPTAEPEPPWRAHWEQARRRYLATAQSFADFECDVAAALRLPALADVGRPATARFIDAFAEASALHTDAYPGPEFAGRFAAAAERAERAWRAAVDAAERIRHATFAPAERRLVEQVGTLLELAMASPYEAERREAYQRASRRLAELERRTGWRLPRPAVAELAHRARPELAA